jgi:hypothetical protein
MGLTFGLSFLASMKKSFKAITMGSTIGVYVGNVIYKDVLVETYEQGVAM